MAPPCFAATVNTLVGLGKGQELFKYPPKAVVVVSAKPQRSEHKMKSLTALMMAAISMAAVSANPTVLKRASVSGIDGDFTLLDEPFPMLTLCSIALSGQYQLEYRQGKRCPICVHQSD